MNKILSFSFVGVVALLAGCNGGSSGAAVTGPAALNTVAINVSCHQSPQNPNCVPNLPKVKGTPDEVLNFFAGVFSGTCQSLLAKIDAHQDLDGALAHADGTVTCHFDTVWTCSAAEPTQLEVDSVHQNRSSTYAFASFIDTNGSGGNPDDGDVVYCNEATIDSGATVAMNEDTNDAPALVNLQQVNATFVCDNSTNARCRVEDNNTPTVFAMTKDYATCAEFQSDVAVSHELTASHWIGINVASLECPDRAKNSTDKGFSGTCGVGVSGFYTGFKSEKGTPNYAFGGHALLIGFVDVNGSIAKGGGPEISVDDIPFCKEITLEHATDKHKVIDTAINEGDTVSVTVNDTENDYVAAFTEVPAGIMNYDFSCTEEDSSLCANPFNKGWGSVQTGIYSGASTCAQVFASVTNTGDSIQPLLSTYNYDGVSWDDDNVLHISVNDLLPTLNNKLHLTKKIRATDDDGYLAPGNYTVFSKWTPPGPAGTDSVVFCGTKTLSASTSDVPVAFYNVEANVDFSSVVVKVACNSNGNSDCIPPPKDGANEKGAIEVPFQSYVYDGSCHSILNELDVHSKFSVLAYTSGTVACSFGESWNCVSPFTGYNDARDQIKKSRTGKVAFVSFIDMDNSGWYTSSDPVSCKEVAITEESVVNLNNTNAVSKVNLNGINASYDCQNSTNARCQSFANGYPIHFTMTRDYASCAEFEAAAQANHELSLRPIGNNETNMNCGLDKKSSGDRNPYEICNAATEGGFYDPFSKGPVNYKFAGSALVVGYADNDCDRAGEKGCSLSPPDLAFCQETTIDGDSSSVSVNVDGDNDDSFDVWSDVPASFLNYTFTCTNSDSPQCGFVDKSGKGDAELTFAGVFTEDSTCQSIWDDKLAGKTFGGASLLLATNTAVVSRIPTQIQVFADNLGGIFKAERGDSLYPGFLAEGTYTLASFVGAPEKQTETVMMCAQRALTKDSINVSIPFFNHTKKLARK
jgi:hypothetical protein